MPRHLRLRFTVARQMLLTIVVALAAFSAYSEGALAQMVKLVGIGASSCAVYVSSTHERNDVEKNYLAWAQGFMSGLLIRAPVGIDEHLDLEPQAMPLPRQNKFLHDYCEQNLSDDFIDAAQALYKLLRALPG
jgi:hypothetical protein